MLGSFRKGADHLAAVRRVKAWTRERFSLADADTVMASEVACSVPGCPPIETVIAFWIGDKRHRFKVFKPVADVGPDDLPPAWMKNALGEADAIDCDCC
jgi:hypothetical protein